MPLTYQCRRCRSERISCEAWAEWHVATQQWVLARTFATAWCHHCDDDTEVVEHLTDPAPDSAPPIH